YQVWFRWSGSPDLDIANHFSVKGGTLGERVVLKNTTVGNETYQLVSCKITTVIVYNDIRYPLDNHLVGCYFVPDYDVEEVMFVADKANSGYDQGLNVPGYSVEDSYAGIVYFQNTNSQSDPTVTGREIYSTLVTATKLTRSDLTVYLKCFITLYGTLIWMVVTLFVCIYHRVNSLAMISGALFGAVSNILVGTGQLSDSLSVGLLEIVNTYGITIILIGTFTILHINQMRVNNNEINEYEQLFGKAMFAVILICAVTVNILIPYLAYR
ncbi:MAG: hypothetical protein RR009_08550, partial [Oscillospiraceae bacterium]